MLPSKLIHNITYKKTLHIEATSIYQMNDSRIAIGLSKGSILIYILSTISSKWKCCINKLNAHSWNVTSFIELPHTRLISSSNDGSIKIWFFSFSKLSLIKHFSLENNIMFRKITLSLLSSNKFISCSQSNTIHIWNCNEPYNLIYTIHNELTSHSSINNVVQLKNRNFFISSESYYFINYPSPIICMWDVCSYQKVSIVNAKVNFGSEYVVEINEMYIGAVCGNNIIIVDSVLLVIVNLFKCKHIDEEVCYICWSLLNDGYFICVCEELLYQVEIGKGWKVNEVEMKQKCGNCIMVLENEGGWFLCNNEKRNVLLCKIEFKEDINGTSNNDNEEELRMLYNYEGMGRKRKKIN